MKIYDMKTLVYETRGKVKIHVKHTSEKNPEDNYDGLATIISNNHICTTASTPLYRMFTIYHNDNPDGKSINSEDGVTTEFYNLDPDRKIAKIPNFMLEKNQ